MINEIVCFEVNGQRFAKREDAVAYCRDRHDAVLDRIVQELTQAVLQRDKDKTYVRDALMTSMRRMPHTLIALGSLYLDSEYGTSKDSDILIAKIRSPRSSERRSEPQSEADTDGGEDAGRDGGEDGDVGRDGVFS